MASDQSDSQYVVNPRMPRPCAPSHLSIYQAALDKWKDRLLDLCDIETWLKDGAPDERGVLLSAATHVPPLPGQGEHLASEKAEQLINSEIFLAVAPDE